MNFKQRLHTSLSFLGFSDKNKACKWSLIGFFFYRSLSGPFPVKVKIGETHYLMGNLEGAPRFPWGEVSMEWSPDTTLSNENNNCVDRELQNITRNTITSSLRNLCITFDDDQTSLPWASELRELIKVCTIGECCVDGHWDLPIELHCTKLRKLTSWNVHLRPWFWMRRLDGCF